MTSTPQKPTTVTGNIEKLAGKYLTFTVDGESYGVDVLQVREIIRLTNITPVPQMPDYFRGVINLRGKVIPVVELRRRFGLRETKPTELTCIIVLNIQLEHTARTAMGVIVDGVEEVANLEAGDLEEAPNFGAAIQTSYILGMAKVKGSVKTLLNMNSILAPDGSLGATAV